MAPFAGFVAPEVLPEVIVKMPSPGALDDIDERLWVPQTADVSFRPLLLNVSSGYYVNLLRVRGAGVLSRHRHPGAVHGWVLKGGGARGEGGKGGLAIVTLITHFAYPQVGLFSLFILLPPRHHLISPPHLPRVSE